MASKSKPAATSADKPNDAPVGLSADKLGKALGLDDGASEAAILSAIEALTKKAEAKVADLAGEKGKLDERAEAIDKAEKAIAERERAVTDQETSLKQEAERYREEMATHKKEIETGLTEAAEIRKRELDAREQKVCDQEAELAERERAVASKVAALRQTGQSAAIDKAELGAEPEDGKIRVTITGPKSGRYRLGRQFTPEPITLDLTKEEFDAVDADPKLQVEEVSK